MTDKPHGALVVGGRNLGRTVARELTAAGWQVVVVARSGETVDAVRRELPEVVALAADVSTADGAETALRQARLHLGRIDLIVNAVAHRGGIGGGEVAELAPDALDLYREEVLPAAFHVLRVAGGALAEQGGGTLVQVTGGSALRALPGRGPWAAAAAGIRAMTHAAAAELRQRGVHVALLVVDGVIESAKTAEHLAGRPSEASLSEEDVWRAIAYLAGQSPRGWTHELQVTPAGDRWLP